eukprot:TRINITY_DN2876_c0_g1_i2.p1 TRINITY_DN2876_c0_g1~~TRINITY_DN2876_c0_g1_i2.p1  ORF type:complete len:316 (-),score=28.97 TRINITY_DN2876_c0_g1_i2:8-955(-)
MPTASASTSLLNPSRSSLLMLVMTCGWAITVAMATACPTCIMPLTPASSGISVLMRWRSTICRRSFNMCGARLVLPKYRISATLRYPLSCDIQGTIQAFAGFANKTTANNVNIFIALAPVAWVYHERAVILRILAELDTGPILELLGDREFYLPNVLHKLLPDACVIYPQACNFLLEFIMGPSNNMNVSRISYYANYEPNPTSVINMIHWSQLTDNNNFQKFDYGTQGNIQHYGQPTPPQYDLGNITLPVALFTGTNDYLADPEDVAQLKEALPEGNPVFELNEASYGHADFILAPDAARLIYPSILKLLQKYNN